MAKLRVGIIGPGQIAQTVHIPGYLKRSEDVQIVAVSGRTKEKTQKVAQQFQIPRVFTDYNQMLTSCNLDAVSICTPNHTHESAVIAALQAGCDVFCEKPPALTVEEAVNMEQAAKKSGKMLTFNFHYRQSAEVEAVKSYVEAEELGNIYSARVHALRRRGIPGWGAFTNKDIQGGGPLIDIGIHMLDIALYLMNDPKPEIVLGCTHQQLGNKPGVGLMGSWNPDKFTVEDAAMGMIRFENGASLILETSFALNMKEKSLMNVELYGNKGGASVFPPTIYQEKHGQLADTHLPFLPDVHKREKAVSDFVDCCLTEKQPAVTMQQAVTVQKIINGFYKSAEKGQAVQLES